MISNHDITAQARGLLKGNWRLPILGSAVYFGIVMLMGCIPVLGWVASMALSGPLMVGYAIFFLGFVRKQSPRLEQLFDGFNHFANCFIAYLLVVIYVILWALLLIVPGVIAAIRYSQTFFILAENPDMEGIAAINKSKEMMNGYKWQFFCLACRFIGWSILGVLSLGIGFLWILPYLQTSFTLFFKELKGGEAVQIQN